MPARLQLIARTGHPGLPRPAVGRAAGRVESERLVEVVRGIHRHVVRFVEYDGPTGPALYALKELPAPIARREYGLLRSARRRRRCPSSRRSESSPSAAKGSRRS